MNPSRRRLTLPLALTIAILAVSTASILIRFAQREASSLAIAALRLVFAGGFLAPIAGLRYRVQLRSIPRQDLVLAAISGLFLAIHFGTWITSLAYTTVASSVVLVSTGPIWVALLSPIFLGERIGRSAVLGLALAIVGGAVIAGADVCAWNGGFTCSGIGEALRGRAMWGNFLALVGAWAVTGYLMIGRRLRKSVALVPYVFVVYSLAGIGLLIAVYATGGTATGLSPMTYLWLVLLALVPQLIGHSTYNWALAELPAASVAATTLGEPIGSAILAYFILQEAPGPEVLIGGALILAGIYLAARSSPPGNAAPQDGVSSSARDAKSII